MKFPLKFLFGVIVFFSFTVCSANAAFMGNSYVLSSGENNLAALLNSLSGYDKPVGFSANSSYVTFSDSYFDYHVSTSYLYRLLLPYLGNLMIEDAWEIADKNKNLIHDDVDDVISIFKDVTRMYFEGGGQVKFKRWNGKLQVYLDDSYEETIGFLGLYTLKSEVLVDVGQSLEDVKATVAHELFHAIENVYIKDGFWDFYRNDNFFEGMAVLMQRNIANASSDYLRFLKNAPFLYPQYSMFGPTEASDLANYGSYIWYNFLQRKYGIAIIEKLLDAYSKISAEEKSAYRSFLAVSDVLEKEGSSINEAYLEYVTWNFDNEKYTDGQYFNDVYLLKKHKSFPTGVVTVGFNDAPTLFASNYIEFDTGDGKNLEVDFGGNDYADFYLTFLSVSGKKVNYDKTVGYLVKRGDSMRFTVPSLGDEKVVLIVSVVDVDPSFLDPSNSFEGMNYVYAYSARELDVFTDLKGSEILDDINLADYFPFEEGKEWTYHFKEDFGSLEKIGDRKIITKKCTKKSSCVNYYSNGLEISYEMFGGKVYAFAVNGIEVPRVKHLASGSVSQLIERNSFELVGFSTDDNDIVQLSMGCVVEAENEYPFNEGVVDVLINECETVFIDNQGGKGTYFSRGVYGKGLGLLQYIEGNLYDGRIVSSYSEFLSGSNFIDLHENFVSENMNLIDRVDLVGEAFTDLEVSHKNYNAIMSLKTSGVINGYPDGTFRPNNPVNRAELLKILVEGSGETPLVESYANCFSDVGTEWFAPYVCYAKEQGWVSGYSDGAFRPAQIVNKVEALKMLLNSNNIEASFVDSDVVFEDVNSSDWFAPFVYKAKVLGILEEDGLKFFPSEGMTRAGISENLYRLIK